MSNNCVLMRFHWLKVHLLKKRYRPKLEMQKRDCPMILKMVLLKLGDKTPNRENVRVERGELRIDCRQILKVMPRNEDKNGLMKVICAKKTEFSTFWNIKQFQ